MILAVTYGLVILYSTVNVCKYTIFVRLFQQLVNNIFLVEFLIIDNVRFIKICKFL